jgi:ABC-type branched-subunit amino acid transport system substrate-binding protein
VKKLLLLLFIFVSALANAQSSRPSGPGSTRPGYPPNDLPHNGINAPAAMSPVQRDSAIQTSVSSSATSLYKATADSTIRVGIILPFDAQASTERLYAAMSDKDGPADETKSIRGSAQDALDFYEGMRYVLNSINPKQRISVYTFDSQNSDSMVQELVKSDTLLACDLIIGPTGFNQARIVATFCKKNRIINIQPFVTSKSFSTENPYLVRFVPTIDAHLQKEYEMVIDSFSDANIIVYTTKRERDLSAARQLDTLFKSYNDINTHQLKYTFLNTGDSSIPAAKRNLTAYLLPKEQNVVLMTCYDEPVVNAQLRTIKDNTVVFGMPTWIEGEQIREDYLSKAQAYFTDDFYVDTTNGKLADFITGYVAANNQKPSRYSYLGYDAMRYLAQIFDKYGKNFKLGFDNESYDGLGYGFHISPMIRVSKTNGEPVINYYANTAMHLFQVNDYKVWRVR